MLKTLICTPLNYSESALLKSSTCIYSKIYLESEKFGMYSTCADTHEIAQNRVYKQAFT